MKKTINNRFRKEIKLTAIATLLACAAVVNATDYTSAIVLNGTTQTFQDGDSITAPTGVALHLLNGATATTVDPSTDTLTINSLASYGINVEDSTVNLGTVDITAATRGIDIAGNSTVSIGNNSIIRAIAQNAVVVRVNSSFHAGDDLTLISDNTTNVPLLVMGGTVVIGNRATISSVNANTAGSSLTIGDYFTLSAGDFRVTGSIASIGNEAIFNAGIRATAGSQITFTENARITATNYAVYANASKIDLGVGANVTSNEEYALFATGIGGEIVADRGTFTGKVAGIVLAPSGKITLTDSVVTGEIGAALQNAVLGSPATELNIIGGSITSTTDSLFTFNDIAHRDGGIVINITDGAVLTGGNGEILNSTRENATSFVEMNVFDSEINGTINSDGGLTVKIADSTWTSTGSSSMDNLILDKTIIEFNMTSASDSITVGNLTLEGQSAVFVGFTNDFLEEVLATGLMDNLDASIVTSFLGGDGNVKYIFATSNDEGSTWDIFNYGDGRFGISAINIVPEPSTYALIFGALALAFATYRRRK